MQQSEIIKMIELEKTHWWYVIRTELISDLAPNKLNNVLEIGSGAGNNLEEFKKRELVSKELKLIKLQQIMQKTGDLKYIIHP